MKWQGHGWVATKKKQNVATVWRCLHFVRRIIMNEEKKRRRENQWIIKYIPQNACKWCACVRARVCVSIPKAFSHLFTLVRKSPFQFICLRQLDNKEKRREKRHLDHKLSHILTTISICSFQKIFSFSPYLLFRLGSLCCLCSLSRFYAVNGVCVCVCV